MVFDMDGTLVVFKFDGKGARRAIIQELASMGFDVEGLEGLGPTQAVVDAAEEQVRDGAVGLDFPTVRSRIYAILDKFETADREGRSAFPGTRSTLRYLASKDVRLAVLTNSGRASTTDALSRAGIADMFEFVLTRDEVKSMKPDANGVTKALSLLRLPQSSVTYVGDSVYDITAAKSVGLKVVSVATGNYSEERLKAEGADQVLRSITELPGALGV